MMLHPEDVLSLGHFVPDDVLSLRTFCPWHILSQYVLSQEVLSPKDNMSHDVLSIYLLYIFKNRLASYNTKGGFCFSWHPLKIILSSFL
jgi:hypothetical protein